MLLPSAFACDSAAQSQPPHLHRTRLQSTWFSPPASPPTLSSQNDAFADMMKSCRMLQSLTSGFPHPHQLSDTLHSTSTTTTRSPPQQPSPPLNQLPTPPMSHAPPPLRLRLRPRATSKGDHDQTQGPAAAPKRIAKRVPARGVHKRRRSPDDDAGREDDNEEDYSSSSSDCEFRSSSRASTPTRTPPTCARSEPSAPSTPKRARIAPAQLPLGLERADFHGLMAAETLQAGGGGESEWTAEDDRVLVELVLDKLRLSKSEWQDCARSLGRDRHAVGRRWKSLMMSGDVGVTRHRRGKLHSTWR